jgi:hypothetical protein
MKATTEFWSFDDSGEGRSIKATLRTSQKHPHKFELDCRWEDDAPVTFPMALTDVDLQNFVDLISEVAIARGIELKVRTTAEPLE